MRLIHKISLLTRPKILPDMPDFRRRIEWLMLLRLMVTTLLLAVTIFFQLRETREFFVHPAVPLYILIGTIFLLSLIYAISLPLIQDLWLFSLFQVIVDVIYATILIHFTGGASSVFTILYIFPIITSGILHFRRGALMTASFAGVCFGLLINLQFYGLIPHSDWPWVSPWSKNTPEYLLWILLVHLTIFFTIAWVASSLAEQLQRTKVSLDLREIDYQKLEGLYKSIVRSIPSGIITTDELDQITFINNSGAAILGTTPSDLVKMPLRNLFPFITNGVGISSPRSDSFLTVKEINGEPRQLELTITDLKNLDSTPIGRLVVFQDVTQIRQMEERVKLNEKQAAFVRIAAGLAHEIRNPLAAIRGATELLSQISSGPELNKRLLEIVIRESDRLNSLLGDFLLTVGRNQPDRSRVILTDLVEETVNLFSSEKSHHKSVSIETAISKGIEVEGDPSKLKQALWNLLINAVEASRDGGTIRITLEPELETNSALFKVQDWGSGIPPEIRDRIFEPFTTTKEKGTGLGLALVLSVVEAHRGTVEVHSTPGVGSTFSLRIPLATDENMKKESSN